jgi:hypothetical protein
MVDISFSIPLFIDLLERCMVKNCDDAGKAPIFQILAEIWSTDRNEPIGTYPLGRDRVLFTVLFHPPGGGPNSGQTISRRIFGEEISQAHAVDSDPGRFLIRIDDTMPEVRESQLNEDWGPFPPPGKPPLKTTQDEVFLRVYLSSLFSAWNTIDTQDSDVQTGQFFGP